MSVMLTYTLGDQDRQIVLDASVNETHGVQAQITDHQVETGPNVTDHIRPMPRRLTIEGVVTNTPSIVSLSQISLAPVQNTFSGSFKPAAAVGGAQVLQFDQGFDRVKDVFNDLVDAARAGVLLAVDTSLKHYDSMAIANLTAPRNVNNSNSIQFTIDLQEIITVSVQLVKPPQAKHKSSRGAKENKEADAGTKERAGSVLANLFSVK